jgi:pyruvate/2-oxoglutarate dehydrogenase complex dihydrolipoamide dehydrogenase (E3) component
MNNEIAADICVIGAGAGGLSVAAAAARLGVRVALVEKGRMGGDCLNFGCVPSKALIAAARRASLAGERLGVTYGPPQVDFAAVRHHLQSVIAAIAPHDSEERFAALGCTVIREAAYFIAPDRVAAGERIIRARRFVIATGSSPAIPGIPGLAVTPFLTNETIFDLEALPAHLIVLGGGPIGCELGQAFRRLGSRVTIVSHSFLKRDDPELAAVVLDSLRRDGVEMRRDSLVRVSATDAGIAAHTAGGETLRGSRLLIAAGRRPSIDGLGLAAAGIAANPQGVVVDRRLRTANRRVYAIGDVTGRALFTHMAGYDAGIVIRHALFRLPVRARADITPWCTFSAPELAQVGFTEAAARAAGHGDIRVITGKFADNDRARTEGETEGLIKIIAGKGGRILGVGIVGPHAGDLIQPWCLALSRNLKLSALAGYIAPYPTLGEATKRAAGAFYEPALFGPWTRRLVALLAKLG